MPNNNPVTPNSLNKNVKIDMDTVYKSLIISDKTLRMPNILNEGGIPIELSGMSPRILKGQPWWNKIRKKTYESTDYHCIACGIHKSQIKSGKTLEAHECYKYDYENYIAEVEKIIPLCHSCHVYLHTGRLMAIHKDGLVSDEQVREIILHGLNVLKNTSTPILKTTALINLSIKLEIDLSEFNLISKPVIKMNKKDIERYKNSGGWKMRIDGNMYKGKTHKELKKQYSSPTK